MLNWKNLEGSGCGILGYFSTFFLEGTGKTMIKCQNSLFSVRFEPYTF